MASVAKKLKQNVSMKLTIERSVLLRALSRLQGIVEKRNTIPILANVKLDAGNDGLALTVTDMDIAASEAVDANIEVSGALTVPAQTFYDIVRKLPDGVQISLAGDEASSQLIVVAGSARFALSYLSAQDFPVMPEDGLTHQFALPVKECIGLIEKARFAMSLEETRYYLNGVYLHVAKNETGDERLRAVATDGHRLARIEASVPEGAAGMPGIIIPRKTVNELKKLVEDDDGNVQIALSDTKIRFQVGNRVLLSKLIDGTFPDYERVIPKENDKILEMDAKLFSEAVDRVSTITMEKTKSIRVAVKGGAMTLSAQSPESGTATEEIPVTYSADPMEIGFNSRYVLEMMAQLEGDTAQFVLSDSSSPALVRDPSDVTALYVIMPMRV
ncbi:MAG: DNA polymerase III subunit beta [Rickettsiales bacterium]|nr:DNA polymerase III subunit beta [Rickettsiales bacterium]